MNEYVSAFQPSFVERTDQVLNFVTTTSSHGTDHVTEEDDEEERNDNLG